MPDKLYKRGCGKSCYRCWINKLNHGSRLKKKRFPKFFEEYESETEEDIVEDDIDIFFNEFIEVKYDEKETEKNIYLLDNIVESYNNWIYKKRNITKQIKHKQILNKLKKINSTIPKNKTVTIKCGYKLF